MLGSPREVHLQETPVVQGWLPQGHGIRGVRPIPTVIYERRSADPVRFLTLFQPLRSGTEDRVSGIAESDEGVRVIYSSGKTVSVTLPPNR